MNAVDFLVSSRLYPSKNQARRMIDQRAIHIDNQIVDKDYTFRCRSGAPIPKSRELDVKSVECYEFTEFFNWYKKNMFVERKDDTLQVVGNLLTVLGFIGIDKEELWKRVDLIFLSMIINTVFFIQIGKKRYYIARLDETPLEFYEIAQRF